MIRVRTRGGQVIDVEEPLKFVEILDKSGNVAMMLHMKDSTQRQAVEVVYPGMDDATNLYSKMFGVEWSKNTHIPFPPPEPVRIHKS